MFHNKLATCNLSISHTISNVIEELTWAGIVPQKLITTKETLLFPQIVDILRPLYNLVISKLGKDDAKTDLRYFFVSLRSAYQRKHNTLEQALKVQSAGYYNTYFFNGHRPLLLLIHFIMINGVYLLLIGTLNDSARYSYKETLFFIYRLNCSICTLRGVYEY